MLKKSLIGISLVGLAVVGFGYWFFSLLDIPDDLAALESTRPQHLPYLANAVQEQRGRILAVVTSTAQMGESGKRTGYELTELSRAYLVFSANGFEVDIASPQGGEPPVVIDDEDMGPFDYAFLNDAAAQSKVSSTIPIADIDPGDYEAVYFVGGKGAMFDFPDNRAIQDLLRHYYQDGKVIGAVCHGPAALVNVKLDNGEYLVAGKQVSGFTNDEELFLIPDARQIFPFLLEDELASQGAVFVAGPSYLKQVSHDLRLITGQNPWSVWPVAETMIRQLGYVPIPRQLTADEHSVAVLATYEEFGYRQARAQIGALLERRQASINRNLIAMHGIVAAMRWDLVKAFELVKLVAETKNTERSRTSRMAH